MAVNKSSVSRRTNYIRRSLQKKGYNVGEITWEPIRRGGIMCGPEGGWYVEIKQPRPSGVSANLLAYSLAECLDKIDEIPEQNVPDQIREE